MSAETIIAAIKTKLEEVTGTGVVHDYFRYRKNWADWLSLMTDTTGSPPLNDINGWEITRKSTISRAVTLGVSGQIERIHTFRIRGIHYIDDEAASEKTFQGILDDIFEEFKDDDDLGGTCFTSDLMEITDVDITDLREFNADTYHTAELRLVVYERINK